MVQNYDTELHFCSEIFFGHFPLKYSPVADHTPTGEPGLVADKISIFWVSASQHGVGANVALTLPRSEVPVGNSKILIAGQSLQRRNACFFFISVILLCVTTAF